MSIEAMKQALQALEFFCEYGVIDRPFERIAELKQAIAEAEKQPVHAIDISQERVDETAKGEHEPYDQQALELCEKCGWKAIIPDEGCLVCARNEHEPVMWSIFDGKYHDVFDTKYDVDKIIKFKKGKVVVKPLYTAPPKKEWVGLTDEEIWDISVDNQRKGGGFWGYPRALEAKIKEKNT